MPPLSCRTPRGRTTPARTAARRNLRPPSRTCCSPAPGWCVTTQRALKRRQRTTRAGRSLRRVTAPRAPARSVNRVRASLHAARRGVRERDATPARCLRGPAPASSATAQSSAPAAGDAASVGARRASSWCASLGAERPRNMRAGRSCITAAQRTPHPGVARQSAMARVTHRCACAQRPSARSYRSASASSGRERVDSASSEYAKLCQSTTRRARRTAAASRQAAKVGTHGGVCSR